MRKLLLLLLLVFAAQYTFGQTRGEWDEWQKTSCYSKISFRLKDMGKHGEQHLWKVQFRSEYPSNISFNYSVTDKLQQYNLTTHRKTLNQGKDSDEVDIYTTYEDIYLLVDKVSMTPYPEDFVECDDN
jgi:hypothetical protein